MTPTRIIHLSNLHTSRRARAIIKRNQDEKCPFCNVKFDLDNDVVVSHGSAKRRYYHEKCAKRLNII
jgi:hypothetical protein